MADVATRAEDGGLKRLGYSVRGLSNWILDLADHLGQPVTSMALNKLLYFAYEKVLLDKGATLTDAKIEAWEHGPVFREIYHAFKSQEDRPIKDRVRFYSVDTGKPEVAEVTLPSDMALSLTEFLTPLLPLAASRLRQISHAEGGAWYQVWCYEGYANPGMEITPQLILSAATRWEASDGRH